MAGGAHLNLVGEDRVSSFDLGVWYSDAAMDVMQASAVYNHINYDWVGFLQETLVQSLAR